MTAASKAHVMKLKKEIGNLFPDIPKTTVSHFIYHHPELDMAETISHFLEIKEPTGKATDISVELQISKARFLLKERRKKLEEAKTSGPKKDELRLMVCKYNPNELFIKFANLLEDSIGKLRLTKKRPRLVKDKYLTKLAYYIANQIMEGNISIDNNDWSQYLKTNKEELIDSHVVTGFSMKTGDTLSSINEMITHEPSWRSSIFSSSQLSGLGVSVSNNEVVFFVLITGDVD